MDSSDSARPDTGGSLASDFEWVNDWFARWAEQRDAALPTTAAVAGRPVTDSQLVQDIVAIARARDALITQDAASPSRPCPVATLAISHRAPESLSAALGTVLGTLVLVAFGAAAAFVNFAR